MAVAADLGLTPNAVRIAKSRVRSRLRQEFGDLIESADVGTIWLLLGAILITLAVGIIIFVIIVSLIIFSMDFVVRTVIGAIIGLFA